MMERYPHFNWLPKRGRRLVLAASLLLLLFSQIAAASHHHDDPALSHDCTVCSQIQTLKHGTVVDQPLATRDPAVAGPTLSFFSLVGNQASVRLPPARAPPFSHSF